MALSSACGGAIAKPKAPGLKYRWLFVWRSLEDPEQVEAFLADMPRAAKAGYNGLVLKWNVPKERRSEVKAAAAKYHLDLIPKIIWGIEDENLMEGLPVKDAVFVAHAGQAVLKSESPVSFSDPGFEQGQGDLFTGWEGQTGPGVYTFRDTAEHHGGAASLRVQVGPRAGAPQRALPRQDPEGAALP